MDVGLEQAGFRIVFSTDADARCSASYRKNFPNTPFVTRRIGELSVDEIAAILEEQGVSEVDLLAGGPPCPAFSKSRFYRKDKPRALDDPIAAETVGGYLRVLDGLRPRAFILENVKGLAYGVHRQALDTILNHAKDLGYSVTWRVVNTADYGVPQIRERCIVVGSRVGPVSCPPPTHCDPTKSLLALQPWVNAGEVLADLDSDENADHSGHFAGGQYHDLLVGVPPGDNYLFYTEHRGHPEPKFKWRSRYWSFLLKLSPNMPSWTIQARRSNNMGPFHWRNRILRISEIKRLQCFPDKYHLDGTVEQQWRQIGNAVPPPLAYAFGKAIHQSLVSLDESRRVA
jgi:DNA (cytosine-5)-methyltransferase 1